MANKTFPTTIFFLQGLTKDEIVAQGVLFFIAGYESTASSITFLLYNLALNPEIQQKLYDEIEDVVASSEVGFRKHY